MATDITPRRTFKKNSLVAIDDGPDRNLTLYSSHHPDHRFVIEAADRSDAIVVLMLAQDMEPFDKRCADALADEVDTLVRTKVIDSRSPAADALLSYRDPPTSPRSDRLVELETRNDELRRTIVRITQETPYPDEIKNALDQRGKLVAEVGTLKARVAELEAQRSEYQERDGHLTRACGERNETINALRDELAERTTSNLALRKQLALTNRLSDETVTLLSNCVRKLGYFVRDYPGDKESREMIEKIDAMLRLDSEARRVGP